MFLCTYDYASARTGLYNFKQPSASVDLRLLGTSLENIKPAEGRRWEGVHRESKLNDSGGEGGAHTARTNWGEKETTQKKMHEDRGEKEVRRKYPHRRKEGNAPKKENTDTGFVFLLLMTKLTFGDSAAFALSILTASYSTLYLGGDPFSPYPPTRCRRARTRYSVLVRGRRTVKETYVSLVPSRDSAAYTRSVCVVFRAVVCACVHGFVSNQAQVGRNKTNKGACVCVHIARDFNWQSWAHEVRKSRMERLLN